MESEERANEHCNIDENILLEENIDKDKEMLIESRRLNAEYNFYVKSINIEFYLGISFINPFT